VTFKLLQTSALVGPLHIVNWNARWNSETLFHLFLAFKTALSNAALTLTQHYSISVMLTFNTHFSTLMMHLRLWVTERRVMVKLWCGRQVTCCGSQNGRLWSGCGAADRWPADISVWYDMMWYDMIRYDTIWYDMIWYVMIWYYDMIWYDMICCDIWYDIRCDVIYDMKWYDIMRYMLWYGMIWYDIFVYCNWVVIRSQQYSTVQYITVESSTVQYSTVKYSKIQYNGVQ
jgi:hypothetical protein